MLFYFQGVIFILNFRYVFKRRNGLTSLLCIQSNLLTEDEIIDSKNVRSSERAFLDRGSFYISRERE